MKRHVAAVAGLSGVGKSTLLRAIASAVPFKHLQASALIQEARQSDREPYSLDQLRSVDLDENQQLLISGFASATKQGTGLIVLDGHTVIERDNSLVLIKPVVFEALGINSMIFLTDEAAEIAKRRHNDKARHRPFKSVELLRSAQDCAFLHAKEICRVLGIPIAAFEPKDVDAIAAALGAHLEPSLD